MCLLPARFVEEMMPVVELQIIVASACMSNDEGPWELQFRSPELPYHIFTHTDPHLNNIYVLTYSNKIITRFE